MILGFKLSTLWQAFLTGLLAFPIAVYPILWIRRKYVVRKSHYVPLVQAYADVLYLPSAA